MSRIFGEIRQIAFVVPSINESMQYWSETLGIGPWFIKRAITLADFRYYARVAPSPTISIALANSGALQVELIEQHDDKPSIYRDFLVSGRSGLQHVSAWVTCAEFERIGADLLRRGFQLAQEGTIASTGTRLAYFATDRGPGTIVYEVSDLLDPKHYGRAQRIVEAARTWDGNDSVREVSA
jgi:Glyoxalase/Bleomycin resistance protein/Dioxygenase superfamily